MRDAVDAARKQRRTKATGEASARYSLRFHRRIVELIGSPLFDTVLHDDSGATALVFSAAPDERRFQCALDREGPGILDLIAQGRTAEASNELSDYLDQLGAALIDYL